MVDRRMAGLFRQETRLRLAAGDIGWFEVDFRTLVPDLRDYVDVDAGWTGPLIVSTQAGDHVHSSEVTVNTNLYVDFSIYNYPFNTVATETDFDIELYVDEVVVGTWTVPAPFSPGEVFQVEDHIIVLGTTGEHRIEFQIDPQRVIPEARRDNNGWFENVVANP